MFKDAPHKTERLFNLDMLQDAMDYINKDSNRKKYFLSLISDGIDKGAIMRVLNNGFAEDFDRYDSDVAELFITTYKEA